MSLRIPFKIISEACQKTQVRVILIGGQALGALGYQRMTLDVDLMITESDYAKLKPSIETHGYHEMHRTDVAAKMRATSEELIDIDFLFVDPATLEGVLKECGKEAFEDCEFFIPKAEHMIALKLHAIKQQPETREFKDLNDIIEIVRANKINVNTVDFKTLCLKFASIDIYEKIRKAVKG